MYLITKEQLEYREKIIQIINSIKFEDLKFVGIVNLSSSNYSKQESYYFKINNILIDFNIYEKVKIMDINYTFYEKNIEKYNVMINCTNDEIEKVLFYKHSIILFYLHNSRFNIEDVSKIVEYKEDYVKESQIYSKFNHMLLIDERKRKINEIFK